MTICYGEGGGGGGELQIGRGRDGTINNFANNVVPFSRKGEKKQKRFNQYEFKKQLKEERNNNIRKKRMPIIQNYHFLLTQLTIIRNSILCFQAR